MKHLNGEFGSFDQCGCQIVLDPLTGIKHCKLMLEHLVLFEEQVVILSDACSLRHPLFGHLQANPVFRVGDHRTDQASQWDRNGGLFEPAEVIKIQFVGDSKCKCVRCGGVHSKREAWWHRRCDGRREDGLFDQRFCDRFRIGIGLSCIALVKCGWLACRCSDSRVLIR